jgi:transcriptional regulator with XRE-family HTH domain
MPATDNTTGPDLGVPAWTLGDRLGKALREADIAVGDMADELGVSRSTVSRWLNDKGQPKRAYLTRWAWMCKVNFEWLKNGTVDLRDFPDGPDDQGERPTKWLDDGQVVDISERRRARSVALPTVRAA